MKKWILYLLILLLPFLGMIGVNEWVRSQAAEGNYKIQGVVAINSDKPLPKKCSWACHNNTQHCKSNHVKWAKPYFAQIDPIYFGIIQSLQSTGSYGLANIVFLVVLIPLTLYFLLVKSIEIQLQIHKRKQEQ